MMFRLCAGFGGTILILGMLGLVLLNNWTGDAPLRTAPATEEELMNMRDALIVSATANGSAPSVINTNRIDRS